MFALTFLNPTKCNDQSFALIMYKRSQIDAGEGQLLVIRSHLSILHSTVKDKNDSDNI